MGKIRQITREIGYHDKETGEILDLEVKVKVNYIGGIWMIVNLDAMGYIAKSKMRGESYRVFWYLLEKLKYNNYIVTSSKVADALNIKPPNVRRAFLELSEHKALIKFENEYYINPRFAWRGKKTEQKAFIDRLTKAKVVF